MGYVHKHRRQVKQSRHVNLIGGRICEEILQSQAFLLMEHMGKPLPHAQTAGQLQRAGPLVRCAPACVVGSGTSSETSSGAAACLDARSSEKWDPTCVACTASMDGRGDTPLRLGAVLGMALMRAGGPAFTCRRRERSLWGAAGLMHVLGGMR